MFMNNVLGIVALIIVITINHQKIYLHLRLFDYTYHLLSCFKGKGLKQDPKSRGKLVWKFNFHIKSHCPCEKSERLFLNFLFFLYSFLNMQCALHNLKLCNFIVAVK